MIYLLDVLTFMFYLVPIFIFFPNFNVISFPSHEWMRVWVETETRKKKTSKVPFGSWSLIPGQTKMVKIPFP